MRIPKAFASALLIAAMIVGAPGAAHEFWLEPEAFRLKPGERLVARGLVGETLAGEELGYYPEATEHLDLTLGAQTTPVVGAPEQIPAVDVETLGEGLHILRFQSANYQVSYPTLEKFEVFLDEWGFDWAAAEHAARNFPQEDIREVYFRYAKALVAVGDGEGADRALGMPIELVALDNPYQAEPGDMLEIELRFQDAPLADGRVKHFHRAPDGTVSMTRLRSDAEGRIRVPAKPGFHLINAVYLDLASERMQMFLGAAWQSLWASLTYGVE